MSRSQVVCMLLLASISLSVSSILKHGQPNTSFTVSLHVFTLERLTPNYDRSFPPLFLRLMTSLIPHLRSTIDGVGIVMFVVYTNCRTLMYVKKEENTKLEAEGQAE